MVTIPELVSKVAAGQATPETVSFTWGLYQGFSGATWTTVHSDGRLIERRRVGPPKLGEPAPTTELGRVPPEAVRSFAATLLSQSFDRITAPPSSPTAPQAELEVKSGEQSFRLKVATPQISSIPALEQILGAFNQLRSQAQA